MAKILAFQAVMPRQGMADQIAALPYDVYSRKEAKDVVRDHPDSFLNIDRAETQFDDTVDTYDDRVYAKARSLYMDMKQSGKFIKDEKPCYYIYQLIMDGRSQTGIVACASVDDYENAIIKRHENTRADKEVDRIRHVDTVDAQTGPIFLAYRENETISAIVAKTMKQKPMFDFVSEDGIAHRGFRVEDTNDIAMIQQAFASIGEIYIADGHHRCASAVKVALKRRETFPEDSKEEAYNYFLSVLFPDKELKILDYNRVLKEFPNSLKEENFLEALSSHFLVEEAKEKPYRPQQKGSFGLYFQKKWYKVTAKSDILSNDAVDGLDVSLLQNYVLQELFEIKDPKTDQRIEFVGGIRGLKELEERVDAYGVCAFSMYPTSIEELFAVADAGKLMPPKSTWFEPKLRSGLFIHDIERKCGESNE